MTSGGHDARPWQTAGSANLSTIGALGDGELLERYLISRDEAAFGVLLARHGPMVLRVCRGVLVDRNDAEDAFQATFLVLARQARSIQRLDSVASWLHGVARRVALQTRGQIARRRIHERRAATVLATGRSSPVEPSGVEWALGEEIARLPASIRAVVLLCYLEGMTYEMAASHLGLSEATVRGRLARARARLQARLSRYGLAWPVPGELVRLVGDLPPRLVQSTLGLVQSWAEQTPLAPVAGSIVVVLAERTMTMMWLNRLQWVAAAAALLVVGVTAGGTFTWAQKAPRPGEQPPGAVVKPPVPPPALRPEPTTLSYGDGQADGKKSLGGSGEMIEFTMPASSRTLTGLKIHGSRYGQPEPPPEQFLIYFLTADQTAIVATQLAPYALFDRGDSRWVEVDFAAPVAVPEHFWVVLDFRPSQSKGVLVSFDSSLGGRYSRTGLPGLKPRPADFGDWMIQAIPAR